MNKRIIAIVFTAVALSVSSVAQADPHCQKWADVIATLAQKHQMGWTGSELLSLVRYGELDPQQRQAAEVWVHSLQQWPRMFDAAFIDNIYMEVYRNCNYTRSAFDRY